MDHCDRFVEGFEMGRVQAVAAGEVDESID